MKRILLLAAVALFFSCSNDDDGVVITNPTAPGLGYSLSTQDFTTTYNSLRNAIQANNNVNIVAEVNHTANAQSTGQDLGNTRLIIFGNPAVGTPLMQANQLAGLDLPQKMLVYQNSSNNVFVAYNSTAYLSARHAGVGGASTLQQLGTALSNFTEGATNATVSENSSSGITNRQGSITLVSNNDFATTYNNLRNAISDNTNLNIIAEVDHQLNAQSVGLTLRPTKLIIFGNPSLGTPLMRSAQTTGIDLPQKMLVWQDENGTVNISYNNPPYLAVRHNINDNAENINTIKSTLEGLAIDAAN
ncbi:DUF302 domain-containing protein [Aequorivita echinoideorum]|uniref:DUF302 domain-containing protein n=1 Tax=Aequorivita echinoideorum TaxID=1549647 RepID=A0ABS5S2K9_9FLAO|nr:DUF302 domain-containing protein [Aequorivita echinoideorum]MBT0606674.1 DUF302 domain-containing protein [Aequorivita echinoideorum]